MKINLFTLLTAVVVQFVVGYLWFGSHFFGNVLATSGHSIDFLKLDITSLLLVVLSGYGLTSLLDLVGHSKNVGGAIKTGLTVGGIGIGLPITMLLGLLGFSEIALLAIITYIVLVTILTDIAVLKLKKA